MEEKKINKNNSSNFLWLLIGIGLVALIYVVCFKKEVIQTVENEPAKTEISDGGDVLEETVAPTNAPKSQPTPKSEPNDPFGTSRAFETLKQSSQNKIDFDFSFENHKETPDFISKNGTIDFELKGTLRTGLDLVGTVPLSIEFCSSDQLSVYNRYALATFDLPFIKETEKKYKEEKILYSFDFKQSLKLDPGRYYFLIVPTGRNRILFTGDFFVREE